MIPAIRTILRLTRDHWLTLALAAVGLALSLAVHLWAEREYRHQLYMEFLVEAQERQATLKAGIDQGLEDLEDLQNLFHGQHTVGRETFLRLSQALFPKSPHTFQAIAWAPRVVAAGRAAFERTAAAEAPTEVAPPMISEHDESGALRAATTREEYFPIQFAYPVARALAPLGFDLASDDELVKALGKAAVTGQPAASAPLPLHRQEGVEGWGILVFYPLYLADQPPGARIQQWDNLLGFLVGVFDLNTMIELSIAHLKFQGVDFQLHDITDPQREYLVHYHLSRAYGERPATVANLQWPRNDPSLFREEMAVADRTWLMTARHQPEVLYQYQYLPAHPPWLLIGLLFTCLVVYHRVRQWQGAHHLVDTREMLRIHASIVAASHDLMALLDPDYRYQAVNAAHQAAFGLAPTAIIGRTPLELLGEESFRRMKPAIDQGLHGSTGAFQGEIQLPGWGARHLDLTCHPYRDDADQVQGVVLVAKDVSERKRMEEERARLQAQAIHSGRLAALGELSASVAHEINNPNNAISFNAEVLAGVWRDAAGLLRDITATQTGCRLGGLPAPKVLDTVPRLIDEIAKSAQRIAGIVANLKEMARQDGQLPARPVAMATVLEATVQILRNKIRKHTDHFQVRCDPYLPSVLGSAQQLEQVLINVILNALEALPNRQAGVRVEADLDPGGRYVRVLVVDQGCGIPAEHLDMMAEPFFTTKLEQGGTGLGLSISTLILENHGGQMTFSSNPGGGATVTILLPVPPEPSQPQEEDA